MGTVGAALASDGSNPIQNAFALPPPGLDLLDIHSNCQGCSNDMADNKRVILT